MASRGAIVCAVMLAACGRLGFAGDGDDAPLDGSTDGSTNDTGPLLDCTMTHPGAKLCSTFEEPDMGEWDYTVLDEGTVSLSTARAYRGSQSLEIETTGADAFKSARWGKNYVFDEIDSGEIYVRAYYWIESSTMVTDQLSILVTGNAFDPYPSANVMLVPGEIHSNVPMASVTADFDFPRDRWTCMVLHVEVANNGGIEVFIDGSRVLGRSNINTRVAGGYTNLDVGVHYATPGQLASHFWIDEVVADTAPVACD